MSDIFDHQSVIWDFTNFVSYQAMMSVEGTTILQQIAGLLQIGASGICSTLCIVGLAIVQAIRHGSINFNAGHATGTPFSPTQYVKPSKARWWQDKNNPGNDTQSAG